jgi:hypothetical protein
MDKLDEAHHNFTAAIFAAGEGMKELLSAETGAARGFQLNGSIAFLGDQGDWHDNIIAVRIGEDGDLVAETENDSPLLYDNLDLDVQHTLLKQFESQWLLQQK